MAREVVLTCDFGQRTCRKPASSYRVWRDGDRQAWAVDLCDEHSAVMLAVVVSDGTLTDLPTKPRQRMEVTKLVTTPRTAALKKPPTKG